MKIHVLMENTASRPDLATEKALSLFVETQRHTLLFDAGQTGAFGDNAKKMGVDLQDADLAVLSHGHYDHGGGLSCFLAQNDHAPVYLSQHAFLPLFNGTEKYIGLDRSLQGHSRLIATQDDCIIDDTLSLHACNRKEKIRPTDPFGLTVKQGDQFLPDDFRHEQYLLVQEAGKRILFSGCSHKGILNIVHWFQPDILIGGFHFKKLDPQDPGDLGQLEQAAYGLLSYPTQYYTCHCTGTGQYQVLRQIMGDRLNSLSAGMSVTL